MSEQVFDDETLMAFADGELDDVTLARVARAIAEDAALAARVDMFLLSRAKLADALGPLLHEPVPSRLSHSVLAMIERDRETRAQTAAAAKTNIVPFSAEQPRHRSTPAWLMPVAAALVLMVGGSGGYFLGSKLPALPHAEFSSIDDPAIILALTEFPSGTALDVPGTGRTIEPVLSFQLEDGTLCREYRLKGPQARGVVSIACLEQDNWRTHLMMASTRPEEGFTPAGAAETIDAYLASIHAGSPLDGTAEDAVLRKIKR